MPRHRSRLQQSDHSTSRPSQIGFASRPFATPPKSEAEPRTPQTDSEPAPKAGYTLFAEGGRTLPIQPKLTIGAPNDKYEQEADRVAKEVVQRLSFSGGRSSGKDSDQPSHPNRTLQRETLPDEEDELQMKPLAEQIQRMDLPEEDELQMKPLLQRQGNGAVAASDGLEAAIQQSRSSGQPLADSIREPMEQAFGGVDFGGVNVHTDGRSDQLNRSIQAKAFTTGQDIYFRQGAYEPGSRSGQELIAHELTHVVQQKGASEKIRPKVYGAQKHVVGISPENQIQRDKHDNPSDFIKWIEQDKTYLKWNTKNEGDCAPAAKEIGALLANNNFTVFYRGILAFGKTRRDGNRNHFVIVVLVNGKKIVVDPTQGQFIGGEPTVTYDELWRKNFQNVKIRWLNLDTEKFEEVQRGMKFIDCATFAEANSYARDWKTGYDAASGIVLRGEDH
ncbi:DUF4157 domain-containing protein [Nodosilinea sp. E11]|uniref:eCIS core domain-containing protein n=1 Tax=Nodosilinea sp. E11 TaxID=3037479 RepID=UPI0029343FE3|nr:DUF4157 domain-containing protein [Nodosilinea sp. E11]WOD37085.1 DUF4157 domain-containing protein [Nodosilinea sp. E11]